MGQVVVAILLSFLAWGGDPGSFPEKKGMYAGFTRSLNSKAEHGYRVVRRPFPVRAGRVSERFELKRGDCAGIPEWDDCSNDRERMELKQGEPYSELGKDYWYAWSLWVPEDFQNIFPVKVALAQFIQAGINQPVLMFQNGEGGYWVELNGIDSRPQLLVPAQDLRGKWLDIVMSARWSKGRDGRLVIWINRQRKFSHRGQNVSHEGKIFFKYGIYRSFVSRAPEGKKIPDQVIFFDEVKWGKTRASVEAKSGKN